MDAKHSEKTRVIFKELTQRSVTYLTDGMTTETYRQQMAALVEEVVKLQSSIKRAKKAGR